ncbi:hypothetical protein ABWI01_11955 [Oceanicaulis alexandrii]|uniref:hypothetical protein n=1 Tax=Oceanicaulis alexandrii TaxID=153233 RepID=UPI0035D0AC64
MGRWLDYIMPETASAPPKARRRYVVNGSVAGALAVLATLLVHWEWVPEPVLLGMVAALCWLLWEFALLIKALDELQHRIHLTALALSGGVLAILTTSWGIWDVIWPLPGIMLVFGFPGFMLMYYIALFFVSRRYA